MAKIPREVKGKGACNYSGNNRKVGSLACRFDLLVNMGSSRSSSRDFDSRLMEEIEVLKMLRDQLLQFASKMALLLGVMNLNTQT